MKHFWAKVITQKLHHTQHKFFKCQLFARLDLNGQFFSLEIGQNCEIQYIYDVFLKLDSIFRILFPLFECGLQATVISFLSVWKNMVVVC